MIVLRKMEPVQGEGDVPEVFLVLGPPDVALEHRPRCREQYEPHHL